MDDTGQVCYLEHFSSLSSLIETALRRLLEGSEQMRGDLTSPCRLQGIIKISPLVKQKGPGTTAAFRDF